MPGFDNNYATMWCSNLNFSDPTAVQFHHPGEFTAAGDLAIGTGNAAPLAQIAIGHLVGLGGIVIGYSTPNITIDGTGAGTALTVHTDGADAVEAANAISIVGAGGITTSGAGSTITITGAGASFTWSNISASQTLAVNQGYFCSAGGALSLALPAVSVVGDTIEVALIGSTSFTVTQSAGQQIVLGNKQTTAGVVGTIATTQQGDAFRMVCQTANLVWLVAPGSMGNFTIV